MPSTILLYDLLFLLRLIINVLYGCFIHLLKVISRNYRYLLIHFIIIRNLIIRGFFGKFKGSPQSSIKYEDFYVIKWWRNGHYLFKNSV